MSDIRLDTRSISELATEALQVQDACNLSGVVHSFSRAISRLRVLLDAEGKGGTSNLNMHPICQLWADKIRSLAGSQEYSDAYRIVSELAERRGVSTDV